MALGNGIRQGVSGLGLFFFLLLDGLDGVEEFVGLVLLVDVGMILSPGAVGLGFGFKTRRGGQRV